MSDPSVIVDKLGSLSESQVEEVLRGPSGDAVLDQVFVRMRDSFQPEVAGGEDALVRFVLSGGPAGETRTYELLVRGGACTLTVEPQAAASDESPRTITIRTDRVKLVRVLTKQANPAKLYLTRKIKIDGDLKFGGRVLSWFGVDEQQEG